MADEPIDALAVGVLGIVAMIDDVAAAIDDDLAAELRAHTAAMERAPLWPLPCDV